MEISRISTALNPFAVSYVPLAKREVQDVEKEFKTMPREAGVENSKSKDNGTQAEILHETVSNIMDEESEMDLAYLQMMFPGVSEQSLADVYNVNGGDLESAVDMLSELESGDDELAALNNDKARESVSLGECLSVKSVSVAVESSTSSGSPGVTVSTS